MTLLVLKGIDPRGYYYEQRRIAYRLEDNLGALNQLVLAGWVFYEVRWIDQQERPTPLPQYIFDQEAIANPSIQLHRALQTILLN